MTWGASRGCACALQGANGLLLSPASARELHRAVAANTALGWMAGQDLEARPLEWHNGSDDLSYSALMALCPRQGVAAAALVNGLPPATEAALSRVVAQMVR